MMQNTLDNGSFACCVFITAKVREQDEMNCEANRDEINIDEWVLEHKTRLDCNKNKLKEVLVIRTKT